MIIIVTMPYKQKILNVFTILNEGVLFVVGCYLFIFINPDLKESTQNLYGWIIIAIVVFMAIVNMGFIIPYKIVEAVRGL